MAYQHRKLAYAIGWQFDNAPGVCTSEGYLTKWPDALGDWPTDAQQQAWVEEYETYLASAQCKNDAFDAALAANPALNAFVQVGIDKGTWTLATLKTKYRSLL